MFHLLASHSIMGSLNFASVIFQVVTQPPFYLKLSLGGSRDSPPLPQHFWIYSERSVVNYSSTKCSRCLPSFNIVLTHFKTILFLFYVHGYFASITCMPGICLQSSEEAVGAPGTGVIAGFAAPCECWESDPRASGRATSVPHRWAISPVPMLVF